MGAPFSHTELAWQDLQRLVPATQIQRAKAPDAIEGIAPEAVAYPTSAEEISEMLKWASMNGVKIAPRGGGSKLGWGNVPEGIDLVLSLEKLTGVVEHAWQDMTVTVRAGTTIAELQKELAKQNQALALDPLWPDRATVGGVIAANDSGARRLRFGSVRDLILGVTVVLANGTIARSGGKVVKNVAGYDLPKLLTGSFGTLGVITQATFRAHPLPSRESTVSFKFPDLESANRFMLAIMDSTLVPTGIQLRTMPEELTIDVRFAGVQEGIDAQLESLKGLAVSVLSNESSGQVWNRERLWTSGPLAIVGKVSVLPTNIASVTKAIHDCLANVSVVFQSTGLGLFRGEADSVELLERRIAELRQDVQRAKGTLVLLHVPLELKKKIDVFGPVTDAVPLMRRVKQQFDPTGTLNPGRFIGGI
jgi:glycolate oxidase FAD binding subunit